MPEQKKYGIVSFFKLKRLRHDRRFFVFLVCLGISTFMWFLNALSKDYETTLDFPVNYANPPENLYLANDPPASFEITINAHGFALLRNKFQMKQQPIVLDIKRLIAVSEATGKQTYRVRTVNLYNRILAQLNEEVKIQEIRPESFLLVLDNLKSKLVKVVPDIQVDFAPQYNISSKIRVTPEFVTIYGPGAFIDSVETIYTKPLKSFKIKKPVDETVGLIASPKITPSPDNVKISIPVEEFTEKKVSVPITLTGKPSNISVKLFPSEIEVSFLIGLSKYSEITSNDFSFSIPFYELRDGVASVPVTLDKKPDFINELKFSPQSVEFLIEK
jgi:hypothetical protein